LFGRFGVSREKQGGLLVHWPLIEPIFVTSSKTRQIRIRARLCRLTIDGNSESSASIRPLTRRPRFHRVLLIEQIGESVTIIYVIDYEIDQDTLNEFQNINFPLRSYFTEGVPYPFPDC